MKLPELENPKEYIGLYVVDFGDRCSTGFTAGEVAELLESERFKDVKVYKIHNASGDGKIELKGVSSDIFQLEAGMFFYSAGLDEAQKDFIKLAKIAEDTPPPARAKLHVSQYEKGSFVSALIYPAEYDDEFSRWLLDTGYRTKGEVCGGIDIVSCYYDAKPQILARKQLLPITAIESKRGTQLIEATKLAVQR
ncbi:MAG: hypothetical protein FVQ79_13215 [Planctomycetes bacterium]|nr:hypothetical protein [Planctomycetota bacterium]